MSFAVGSPLWSTSAAAQQSAAAEQSAAVEQSATAEQSTAVEQSSAVEPSATAEQSSAASEPEAKSEASASAPSAASPEAKDAPCQPAPQELAPVMDAGPRAPGEAPEAVDEGDTDAVFRAFAEHARHERTGRFIRGGASIVGGGTLIGVGRVLDTRANEDPLFFYIAGGALMAGGLLGLLMPSPAEKLATRFNVDATGHTRAQAESLELAWQSYADRAETGRFVGATLSTALALGALGSGIAISVGAGDLSDSERAGWSTALLLAGGGLLVPAVGQFILPTSAELSYETYLATQRPQVSVSAALWGAPGGAVLGAAAAF